MNGIMFALEELEAGGKNDAGACKEALSLLRESSDDLMHKYKVMKQAYSSSADNRSFDLTKLNIENYLLKKNKTHVENRCIFCEMQSKSN
ncbi:MAG: hypothetical protein ACR5K6_04855 [Wolbachia sp.]